MNSIATDMENTSELSSQDMELIKIVQYGLPLCSHPYAEIGKRINMDENDVITRLKKMKDTGMVYCVEFQFAQHLGLVLYQRTGRLMPRMLLDYMK